MIRLREFLDYRSFLSFDEIKAELRKSGKYRDQPSELADARGMLIFSTSKQQTWLIATSHRLYCVIDDKRESKPEMRWSIRIDGGRNIDIESEDYSEHSGQLHLAAHRVLFSKKLFTDTNPIHRIDRIIRRMTGSRGTYDE